MMLLTTPGHDNRARGVLRAGFRRAGGRTEPCRVYETGGYRLRFPRHAGSTACEGVIVNTGGGMAGGDHLAVTVAAEAGAEVVLTTTAAEKIYRAEGVPTRLDLALDIAEGATVEWLPQETILFDRAALRRHLAADLHPGARLLMAEMLVFGRLAMGEIFRDGLVEDQWRIRRGGRLVFAEALRLEGGAVLDRPALGGGARAVTTVLAVGADAQATLPALRSALEPLPAVTGSSAFDGMLVLRALAPSPEAVRAAIVTALAVLRGRPLPRLWH